MTSRRMFLQQASAIAAAGLLTHLPSRRLWALPPVELLPEPDEALMRELALTAMNAARAAGASFADIRLAVARSLSVGGGFDRSRNTSPVLGPTGLNLTAGYGIRAIVDGAWGFAHGVDLTADAVAATARTAVAGARSNRPRHRRALDLAPRPRVANGVWATLMERDPLTVPLGEQGELILAALAELMPQQAITNALLQFHWRRPTTVFAATDGTLVLQRLATARPGSLIYPQVGVGRWSSVATGVASLRTGSYGYEAVRPATLLADVRQAGERAVALARAARAPASVEVGRYDLVFGPRAVAELVGQLAGALNLPRALGYHANTGGTSFAAPPAEMLGRYQIASPLIAVRADRTQSGGAATVGWDEEGVQPEDYTFIHDGIITDYHTDRQTAMELGDWSRAQGEPIRAHGCCRRTGADRPIVLLPNLTLDPGADDTTVDDLIADTKRGFFLEEVGFGGSDQQMLSTQYQASHARVRRITNGKLGNYVRDFAFQYVTPEFWKRVDGLGGAASSEVSAAVTDAPAAYNLLQPFPDSTMRTVPLRVRQVNVLNTGRTA